MQSLQSAHQLLSRKTYNKSSCRLMSEEYGDLVARGHNFFESISKHIKDICDIRELLRCHDEHSNNDVWQQIFENISAFGPATHGRSELSDMLDFVRYRSSFLHFGTFQYLQRPVSSIGSFVDRLGPDGGWLPFLRVDRAAPALTSRQLAVIISYHHKEMLFLTFGHS